MPDDVKERIEQHLDAGAVARVHRYFNSSHYPGRRFERFDYGGTRNEVANIFTAADLVAVSMLGVRIHGISAIDILETRAADFNEQLALIPVDLDLWDAEPNVIGPTSPARALWHELMKVDQVYEATASKLMARKRPKLIPVYDRVIMEAIGAPYDWWAAFHDALQDPELRYRLTVIRTKSEIGDDITVLRVMDVAVWTAHEAEADEDVDL